MNKYLGTGIGFTFGVLGVMTAVLHNGATPEAPASQLAAQAQDPVIFQVEGLQRYPSSTLKDWTGVADAVVTIRVDSEKAESPTKSETVTGSGVDIVGRTVHVTVLDHLWNAPDASSKPEALPNDLSMSAWGWAQETGSGEVTPVTAHGTSRLQVGQTYVTALKWYSSECLGELTGSWGSIGSGGVLPLAGSTIGSGEFEGRYLQPEAFAASAEPGTVADDFAGKDLRELAIALASTPVPQAVPDEPAPCRS